jgi:beta-lactamase regulating signal transducer with metallopeptidase domain
MTPLADAVSAALIHSLWQDSMVAFLLWVALVALRQRPNARYAAGCVALALMAVLPALTAGLLYLEALRPETVSPAVGTARAIVGDAGSTVTWMGGSLQPGPWLARLQTWALPVWSMGVLLFSLRLVGGGAHALALRRRSEDADEGIRSMVARLAKRMGVDRLVRVAISARTDGPATLGWLRPVILLPPATAMGLTPQQLEAVLAHELAHIRRHDYLVNVLQMAVETLFFYHPAVWWASRQIRIERELCCDDLAVGSCGDALCYAQALTTVAKLRVTTVGMAVGATGGTLVQRIERLLGGTKPEHRSQWPALLALSLALASGALNVSWMRAHAQGAEPAFVYSGLWEIRPATTAGSVQLRLCYADLFSRAEMPLDSLEGFGPGRVLGANGPIRFGVRRDAGTFDFEGELRNGGGAGTYTFTPDSRVSEDLETRGFEPPTTSLQHTLALHDLGLAFLDDLRAQGVSRPDTFRFIHIVQARARLESLHTWPFDTQVRTSGWC